MKNIGFSLVELLVVVAIIGALAAAGVVGYQNYSRDAKIKTGAYNMNSVFRFMLNVRQQLPLVDSLGGNCEVKIGSECATVESDPEDFLSAFKTKVSEEFGFENPIHPDCPITMVYFIDEQRPAATVEEQLTFMGLSSSLLADCVEQPAAGSAPEYIEGAIYFRLFENQTGPDLEYFEASMFMPCGSLYSSSDTESLCR